jgi:hypothetical protein
LTRVEGHPQCAAFNRDSLRSLHKLFAKSTSLPFRMNGDLAHFHVGVRGYEDQASKNLILFDNRKVN